MAFHLLPPRRLPADKRSSAGLIMTYDVVVVGAGFGGLTAAKILGRYARVLLIDRRNYHCFTPLLYQVATAGLEPEEIVQPVRRILSGKTSFRLAEVTKVDLAARKVITPEGEIPYRYLVLALGSVTNFFGLRSVKERAFGIKDLREAVALRNHVLRQFEKAALEVDEQKRAALLTFVIVGGGPTGVEMAGAVCELVAILKRRDYQDVALQDVGVILLEAADRLLLPFRPALSHAALQALREKGVEVMLGARVADATRESVHLADGRVIYSHTIIWTAGVLGNPLELEPDVDRQRSRISVLPTLQLPGHPEVYVVGDLAFLEDRHGVPLPMMAPVAIQQGEAAAKNILHDMRGERLRPFRYRNHGIMATIGRTKAVAQIGFLSLRGFTAWVAWLVVHLIWLIGFRNKLIVLLAWAWDYFLYDRSVRVITDDEGREGRAHPN
jgi:NADH dehydrogenase